MMKLTQKRPLLGTVEFELDEANLQICTRSLTRESRHTIALQKLDPSPSYHRSAPVQWLVFAVIFGGVALFALYGLIHEAWVPDKSGMVGTSLIFAWASAGCVYVFYRKKIDLVVLHAAGSRAPLVFMHRRLPTEVHVKEFVQIIQERIAALRSV